MTRTSLVFASLAVLGLGASVYATSRKADDLVDRVQGIRISSRIPCDGATNPQDDVGLETTFSPGGLRRAFHLDVFESQYCHRVDLYFFCLSHGHDHWKHQWVSDSANPTPTRRFWVNSCADWGSANAPEYVLSGWYAEGEGKKLLWKQAAMNKVGGAEETYEFADSGGGTARVVVKQK